MVIVIVIILNEGIVVVVVIVVIADNPAPLRKEKRIQRGSDQLALGGCRIRDRFGG